ncbi:MAG: NAD(P)-binding domain-containing protein [Microbacterium gubbeenense]
MTKSTISVTGAGRIGQAIAELAVRQGHPVVLSNSRGPETLQAVVDELGPLASSDTTAGAASQGDIVVIAVTFDAIESLPRRRPDRKSGARRHQLLRAPRRSHPRGGRRPRSDFSTRPTGIAGSARGQGVQPHRLVRHPRRCAAFGSPGPARNRSSRRPPARQAASSK